MPMRGWVRTVSGRRYLTGGAKRPSEGLVAPTPTDERVNRPKAERAFSERDLGGGIVLTSWEDPPLTIEARAEEEQTNEAASPIPSGLRGSVPPPKDGDNP